jgi:hypothetical protein
MDDFATQTPSSFFHFLECAKNICAPAGVSDTLSVMIDSLAPVSTRALTSLCLVCLFFLPGSNVVFLRIRSGLNF